MTLKVSKKVSQILKETVPHRGFNVMLEDGVAVVNYDANLTEDEEMKIHEVLDKLNIKYRMERMVF